jgi:hypothetical protein
VRIDSLYATQATPREVDMLAMNGWRQGRSQSVLVTLLATLGFVTGCASQGTAGAARQLEADELRVTGTVHKAEVGANCWLLEGTDSARYELRPDQAPAALLTEGKAVTVVLRPRSDLMSVCMVGRLADVVSVE